MKKIFAIAAVLVMGIAGMFALDLKDIQGTWHDSNWDANWTFNADGKIFIKVSIQLHRPVRKHRFRCAGIQNM